MKIILAFWSFRIIGNILTYIYLWWVKEYRFDRMLIHLRSPDGKRIFFPSWRRPPLRLKTSILSLATMAVLVAFFRLLPFGFFNIFFVDLLSFLVVTILVLIFWIPTRLYHAMSIARALRLLRSHKKMTVIGITGSYGKTSVKDYLASILATKYKVLKTEASKNSPIGIAETIVSGLKPDHEVFVVEMGAYKKGEIAGVAQMVQPEIGIVTAINPQHQDLFGTIENTVSAKYELIQGLSGKKLGIFNADDQRVQKMASWAKRDGVEVWKWSKNDVKNIEADMNGITFLYKNQTIYASVLGEHQISNMLAAVLGAVACGMNVRDACRAASHIQSAKGVMQKVEGLAGATFIDDTFNNNPDAAKAAIEFLKKAKGRKILVFQPMIELGTYAASAHRDVGEFARRVCDEIIVTNNTFARELNGRVMHAKEAVGYLRKTIQKGDTVLFKGKEAGLILSRL